MRFVVEGSKGTYRVGARRLGATSLPCDDDLVDRKDSAGGLGGETDGPVLGGKEVQDALFLGVEDAGVVIVLCSVSVS